ncbi:MAG: hypothetical protein QOH57_1680 [Mycobacterium sp.]|jgi:SAM-dependent methyltransferase|nr:hypothetical protein [Mycobacterium sp.]
MSGPEYVLGSDEEEIARLGTQAAALAEPTALLLQRGGIRAGMHVMDLGCGPGNVTFQLAEIVGPDGSVLGVDQDSAQLAAAETRRSELALPNVAFRKGDARTFTHGQEFDAIATRLLLFHLPDAGAVVKHHVRALRPGGTFVAVDYDMGGVRVMPPVELVSRARDWIEAGFRYAQADPFVGMRLPVFLKQAGLHDVGSLGIQVFWPPENPNVPLMTDVVRALAPAIVASGAATEDELDLATLEQRVREALTAAGAVWTGPTVVGAWGRRA